MAKTDKERYDKIWSEWLANENVNNIVDYHRQERKPLIDLVGQYLGEGKKFLEVGCGSAVDSYIIKEKEQECEGYIIDLSYNSFIIANKISSVIDQRLFMSVMNGEQMAFSDKTFDVIFSQGVIEHFRDPGEIMKDQRRILKDGGKLIVSVPQKFNPYTIYKRKQMRQGAWEWGWETEYTLAGLKALGERSGLKIIAWRGHEYASNDYGLWYLRNIIYLLQRKNPLRKFFLFSLIENSYDRFWQFFEKRWGHLFMLNITVVYEKNNQ